MAVYQNLNQLNETPIKGMMAGVVNPDTISVQMSKNATGQIIAGDLVDYVIETGKTVIVEKASATSTGPIGFVVYSPKKNKYTAGETFEVAITGSIIYLESAGAIKRGHSVEFVPTGSLVKSALFTNPFVGTALDNATASGQLIRVLVNLHITDASNSSSSSSKSSSCSSSSSSCRSSSSSSSSSCRSSSSSSSSNSSSSSSSSSISSSSSSMSSSSSSASA